MTHHVVENHLGRVAIALVSPLRRVSDNIIVMRERPN